MTSNYLFGLFLFFLVLAVALAVVGLTEDSGQVATTAAVLAAVAASMLAIFSQRRQQERDSSQFYLTAYLDGVESAANMLEDGNNDRVRWITAARILSRCRSLELLISEADHRNIIEIRKDEHRHRFGRLLGFDDPGRPAAFFYGSNRGGLIDIAAEESTRRGPRGRPQNLAIDEASIFEIWQFAHFPENYEDPLGARFSRRELSHLRFASESLYSYLEHTDRFESINGQTREREPQRVRDEG